MTTEKLTNMRMYWLHAITPLHVGSGKGVGFIDMPVMREKVTNWPLVPGSAAKGVMRDYFREKGSAEQKQLLDIAFGVGGDETGRAGSLVLSDAHIVCLPIRSLYGTFAYVTSQLVLERLKRDLIAAGFKSERSSDPSKDCGSANSSNKGSHLQGELKPLEIPETPEPKENEALYASGSKLAADKKIFFEDLDFTAKEDADRTQRWAELLAKAIFSSDTKWQSVFKERFAVVSDNSFNFLSETGTEVAAHIKIEDETKIVANRALWYEEALPIETILAGIAWCDRVYGGTGIDQEKILGTFCGDSLPELQIGGKATVGKGRVRCQFTKVEHDRKGTDN